MHKEQEKLKPNITQVAVLQTTKIGWSALVQKLLQ